MGVGCVEAKWLPDNKRILSYCRSLMQAGVVLYEVEDQSSNVVFEGQGANFYGASRSGALALSDGFYLGTDWGGRINLPHQPSGVYQGVMALAWSPTAADQLAVRAFDELYVTNLDGSRVSELVGGLPSKDIPSGLSWSPDGSQLVFDATLDGNQEILLAALDQRGAIRLTFTEARESQPVWQP
jgi:hypothetical protein